MMLSVVNSLVEFLTGQVPVKEQQLLDRADVAVKRVRELMRKLDDPASISKILRQRIKKETGVGADPNPYFKLDDQAKMLACIVTGEAQNVAPELILALWMKEATASFFSSATLNGRMAVTNEDDAKALFIAINFYHSLGGDLFTHYRAVLGKDNQLLIEGKYAPDHRATLDKAGTELMSKGFAKFDYVKAMRENLNVSGGSGGQPFHVEPEGLFYPAMLALSHAYFEKIRTEDDPLFREFNLGTPYTNEIAYLLYNNGRGSKGNKNRGGYALLKAHADRAADRGMTLQDYLMRTKIVDRFWEEPRTNLVRFDYFHQCYAPIFA